MNTKLLKFSRKHYVLFCLKYGRLIEASRRVREIDKLTHKAQSIADACCGWDIDRDTYDTCIIAAHYLQQVKNDQYELD